MASAFGLPTLQREHAMTDPDPKPVVPDEAPPGQPNEIPDEGGDVDFPGETPAETPPIQ
jgi:hypothetical protein